MEHEEWGANWGTPPWMAERPRVLVVDDMPEMVQLMERYLALLPVDLDVAHDGWESLRQVWQASAEGNPFELVLMDMEMPEYDGYAAARRLREEGYGGVIVAVTAHSRSEHLEAALTAGCDVFVPKPITREGIARTVRALLDIG